ncbi:hypothetical protein SDC9_100224 [bioreactor metagenome]|uniref:Uncharacterized protein n=1 Tax=bioreactor metagenome TaxID=1076179 RepID=A0A645AKJ3_9ZZZZ
MFFIIQRSVFCGFLQVSFEDNSSVQGDFDVVTVGDNLLIIPFAVRFQVPAFSRNDAIYRTMILIFFQFAVDRCVVVEDLKFHAHVSCIAFHRCTYTQSVVSAGSKLEFKSEYKIAIFFFGV